MRTLRQLSYIGTTIFLTSAVFLAGCSGGVIGDPETTGGGETSGGSGSSGSGGPGPGPEDGGDPDVCIPGIPATSQIPRLLNREYDAVVKDLLDVTTLSAAAGGPPSTLLVADFEGSLTDIAWNSYLVAAESIAAEVMAGPNRSNFISCNPAAPGCFEQTIRSFGRKAFRRPLTDAEVERFMKLTKVEPQGTPEEIAETILYAFLASPSFIMRPELSQEREGNAIKLSSHEVAARLAFTLWGTIPDEELNAVADAGLLTTKEQILEQAQRMVNERDKAAPMIKAIHRAYADIREGSRWGVLDHDTDKYPHYSKDAVEPMMAEVDAFFEEVAYQGGSFKDLFLSNVAFVNKHTAPLYGLNPADYGEELKRVELDASERPGLLTRAAFLSSYSSYADTSPILRGAFITTRLLGIDLKPIAGVENTPIPPGNYTTRREAIEALTSGAACVECHSKYVNPPGFVLERYDAVGRVQTVDPLGGVIDPTSVVNFGDTSKTISSPLELMTELGLGPVARRHYAERFVSFATRRSPNSKDACTVDALSLKLSNDGYTILDMLVDLTQADSFRLRVVGN